MTVPTAMMMTSPTDTAAADAYRRIRQQQRPVGAQPAVPGMMTGAESLDQWPTESRLETRAYLPQFADPTLMERFTDETGKVIPGAYARFIDHGIAVNNALKWVFESMGLEGAAAYQQQVVDTTQRVALDETLFGQAAQEGGPGAFIGGVATDMLPSLGAAKIRRGAKGAALLYYGIVAAGGGSEDYAETMRGRGMEPDAISAITVGVGYGAIEVVTEKLGIDLIGLKYGPEAARKIGDLVLKGEFSAAGRAIGGIVGVGASGASEEAMAQLGQNAIALAFDPERPIFEGVGESAVAGMLGAQMHIASNFGLTSAKNVIKPPKPGDPDFRPTRRQAMAWESAQADLLSTLPHASQQAIVNRIDVSLRGESTAETQAIAIGDERVEIAINRMDAEAQQAAIEEIDSVLDDQAAALTELDRESLQLLRKRIELINRGPMQHRDEADAEAWERVVKEAKEIEESGLPADGPSGEAAAEIEASPEVKQRQPSIAQEVRGQINALFEAMGIRPREKGRQPITKEQRQAVRDQIEYQVRSEREKVRAARMDQKQKDKAELQRVDATLRRRIADRDTAIGVRDEVIRLAKQYMPPEMRGRILTTLPKIRPGSRNLIKKLAQAVETIKMEIDKAETAEARSAARDAMKALKSAKLRPEFHQQVKEKLRELNIQPSALSSKKRAELEALENYVMAYGDTFGIAPAKIAELARLTQRPVSELSKDEAQYVADMIAATLHANDMTNKLIMSIRNQQRAARIDRVLKEMQMVGFLVERKQLPSGRLEPPTRVGLYTMPFSAIANTNQGQQAELLGGPYGMTYKVLADDIFEAEHRQLSLYQSGTNELHAAMDDHGFPQGSEAAAKLSQTAAQVYGRLEAWRRGEPARKGDTKADIREFTLESGDTIKVDPDQRMHLMAALMDEWQMHQITRENGGAPIYIDGTPKGQYHQLTVNDAYRILNPEDEEGKNYKAFVTRMMDYIAGPVRDAMRQYSIETHGFDITQAGYYFPINRVIEGQTREDLRSGPSVFAATIEGASITKYRSGGARPIRITGFIQTFNNLTWTNSQVTQMGPAIRAAREVLQSAEITRFMSNSRKGRIIRARINERFEAIAKEALGSPPPSSISNDWLKPLVQNIGKSLLGFNLAVPFYQPGSIFCMRHVLPVRNVRRAVRFVTDLRNAHYVFGGELMQEIHRTSPYAWHRGRQGAQGIVHAGVSRSPQLTGQKRDWTEGSMFAISAMDNVAIRVAYLAAKFTVEDTVAEIQQKNEARDEMEMAKIKTPTEEQQRDMTRKLTDLTIQQTQPTWNALHDTSIGVEAKSNVLFKMMSMFRSQRNKNLGMTVIELYRYRRARHLPPKERTLARRQIRRNLRSIWIYQPLYIMFFKWLRRFLVYGLPGLLAGKSWDWAREKTGVDNLQSQLAQYVELGIGNVFFADKLAFVVNRTLLPESGRRFEPDASPVAGLARDQMMSLIEGSTYIRDEERSEWGWTEPILDFVQAAAALAGKPIVSPLRDIRAIIRSIREEEDEDDSGRRATTVGG
jgi:hypothetical protein